MMLGHLDHDRLASAYCAADLLLLPSLTEGFPLVVQEALACGTAVLSTEEVATACPEATAMIRFAPVPTEPGHVKDWETALRATLADRDYIADREARSNRARALWSWPDCADEYVRVYEAAISGLATP
jgi:glycosyltransferase involved in cell wall biosynthesis